MSSLLHVSMSPLDKKAFCDEGYKHSLNTTVRGASWVFDLVSFLAVCGHSHIWTATEAGLLLPQQ